MKNGIFTKATTLASVFILGAIVAQPAARAEQNTYVSIKAGTSSVDVLSVSGNDFDFHAGYALFGALGFDTGEISEWGKIRLEAEIGYRENSANNLNFASYKTPARGGVKQISVMANVYHDFLPGSRVRPYLGVGVGVADLDAKLDVTGIAAKDSVTAAAYQAMTGLSIRINQRLSLDTEYRYTGVAASRRIDDHAALAGLRFGF